MLTPRGNALYDAALAGAVEFDGEGEGEEVEGEEEEGEEEEDEEEEDEDAWIEAEEAELEREEQMLAATLAGDKIR